jgi:formylglycine-generating enzyme required for sulfatase activity
VDTECWDDEKPGRRVQVSAFQIDKTEVTVSAYRRCVQAGACSAPATGGSCNWGQEGRGQHPVNCIDWEQARTYCTWAGKRLPTEAEWEKAARGTDGRKYAWGNRGYGAAGLVANIADEAAKRQYPDWTVADGYNDGFVETAPVGSFPAGASPYGAVDMIGNVWEWTADWDGSGRTSRVVRGGSWYGNPRYARASYRLRPAPGERNDDIGVRCAQ